MELEKDQKIIKDELIKRYLSSNNDFNTAQILPAMTGMGKTRIAAHVIKYLYDKLGIQPLIFCPKTLIPMWEETLKLYEVEPLCIMSYSKLSGYGKNVNHPFLTKIGNKYQVTKAWKNLNGVMLICDESQAVKNKTSARHKALYELIRYPMKNKKILHLTASAIDKKEHWIPFYKHLNLVTRDYMMTANKYSVSYEKHGLGEIFDLARKYDKKLVTKVIEKYNFKPSKIPDMLMKLWKNLFKYHLVIPVIDPIYKHPETGKVLKHNVVNFFANLDSDGKKEVKDIMHELKEEGVIKEDGVDMKVFQKRFGNLQGSLMGFCRSKVTTVIRLALVKLKSNQNRKIIVSCPFLDDQYIIAEALEDYGCLLLNGKTKNRQRVLDKFNAPNDKIRVLIMSTEIGSEGVSLHDLDGNFPRTMFIIPSFAFIKVFQACGRIYRRGQMSDSEVFIIYSNDSAIESILINGLAKTEMASMILIDCVRQYPGAYPYQIEGGKKQELERNLKTEQARAKSNVDVD